MLSTRRGGVDTEEGSGENPSTDAAPKGSPCGARILGSFQLGGEQPPFRSTCTTDLNQLACGSIRPTNFPVLPFWQVQTVLSAFRELWDHLRCPLGSRFLELPVIDSRPQIKLTPFGRGGDDHAG